MRVFFYYIRLAFQELFEYRLNLFWRISGSLLEIGALFLFWSTVVQKGGFDGQFTQFTIAQYFFLVALIQNISQTQFQEFVEDIREGYLTIYTVRPQKYFHAIFAKSLPEKIIVISIFGLMVVVLQAFGILFFTINTPFLFGIIAVFLAIVFKFIMSSITGGLSFWFQRVHGFDFLFQISGGLFAGTLMPIELLPRTMQIIATFLPFRYFVSFPIETILGKLSVMGIVQGIGLQIFWIMIFYWLSKVLWTKGYREFEAVGR